MDYKEKIFEILGVMPYEFFYIEGDLDSITLRKGYNDKKTDVKFSFNSELRLTYHIPGCGDWFPTKYEGIEAFFTGKLKIKKIPRPTEEEKIAIAYAKFCGYSWIAVDSNGEAHFYKSKPEREYLGLVPFWRISNFAYSSCELPISFISWKDEPYYIGDFVEI